MVHEAIGRAGSANRTCVLAGDTLTSTAPGSAVRKRKSAGCRSVRIASREACPIARASDAVLDRTAVDEEILVAARGERHRAARREARDAQPPARASNSTRSPSVSRPKTWRMRAARSTAAGASSTGDPSSARRTRPTGSRARRASRRPRRPGPRPPATTGTCGAPASARRGPRRARPSRAGARPARPRPLRRSRSAGAIAFGRRAVGGRERSAARPRRSTGAPRRGTRSCGTASRSLVGRDLRRRVPLDGEPRVLGATSRCRRRAPACARCRRRRARPRCAMRRRRARSRRAP